MKLSTIASKSSEGYVHDPATLSDVWLPADDFYRVLQQWQEAFDSEWAAMPKILDASCYTERVIPASEKGRQNIG